MFKALLCLCLLAGSVFSRAQETEKDPLKSDQFRTLKKSFETLPLTVVTEAGKPVQLVWKDGSRIAELQLGTKSLNADMPLSFSQNTCGNKATGVLCTVQYNYVSRGIRMVWTKHPKKNRLGKPVKVEGTDFEALDFNQLYSTLIEIEDLDNVSLLANLPGDLLPMTCKGSDWLPPAVNGVRQIISIAQDGTENNDLSPENLVQTQAEIYDLELLQKDRNKFAIKRPENPYFNIGAKNGTLLNDRDETDGDILGDEGNILTFKQGADSCRIQMRSATDTSEFVELFGKAKMKISALTFADFLKLTDRPDPTPKDPNFRRSRFYAGDYRELMRYKDTKLASAIRMLGALNLIKDDTSTIFIAGNCRPDIQELKYCEFKLKELE